MASYTLSPVGGAGAQFFDNNGVPLSGGKIYTYAAGSTTPQTTWTTPAGAVANSNPIVLDSAGRPPQEIWLSVAFSYKFVLETSNGVLIGTYDNIPGLPQPAIANDASSISYQEGNTVTAGAFVTGRQYMIDTVGTTDFTLIGASANSSGILFTATGAGAGTGTAYNTQTVQAKLSQYTSVKDFGAVGDNVTNDAVSIQNSFAANRGTIFFPKGEYKNSTAAVTLPFGKTATFDTGAEIVNSGSGSFTSNGVVVHQSYNPDGWLGWTTPASENFEGFSVDFNGYGPRSFSGFNTPSAISGSTRVPADSTLYLHADGVSGWVRNSSTTTGAVALYGQSDRDEPNALVWGLNTRTQDNGYGGLNVWGYEMNLNIDNVTTTALGFDAVGGSTVEPNLSIAYFVQPIGIFATPKKRWRYAFRTTDASAIFGIELGARTEGANSDSQTITLKYRNSSDVQEDGLLIGVDSNGNALIKGGSDSQNGLLAFQTFGSSPFSPIAIQEDKVGFYGNVPVVRPTITGSRGGNAALASLLTQLDALGLITDGTSA
jgi:hypothetical protein